MVSKNGLRVLREALGLSSGSPGRSAHTPSPVLLSIDFETTDNLMNGFAKSDDCQVGIATLDTRELGASQPEKLISTYNLITGSPSYVSKAEKKFLFGKSTIIRPSEILKNIESIVPRGRSIIIIGHGVRVEVRILARLGLEFSSFTSDIIDTKYVANEVFGAENYTLRELLTAVGCPFDNLHSGGNDAHFTLRAALLLAARSCLDRDHAASAATLETVATRSIPVRVSPQVKAARKRETRLAKCRKHQSKSWSVEKQDEIRAERAARREEAALRVKCFGLV